MIKTTTHIRDRTPLPNPGENVEPKRCVIYLRVSSREQADEGYSISAQREACRRLIEDRGWTFVDEYVDAGESARTADRPAFQSLLNRVSEDPTIDVLVVHKLDRLARNLEDHVGVRARLRRFGVQLVSVSESLEESATGKLVEGILASIAEFYSANLSQEIRKGLREKARQGGWPGLAPVGYRNVRYETSGRRGEARIVPDGDQAHLVREAFELYATGEWPLTKLQKEMLRRGLRTRRGAVVSRSNLAKLLHNPIYIGTVIWEGVEHEGTHEPLVTRELFERVQEVFRLHDRAGTRQRRRAHYLRGTLFCGKCGSRLSSTIAKGRFPYFFCLGAHQRRTACREHYVPATTIEREVEALYRTIRLPIALREKIERAIETEATAREQGRVLTCEMWRGRLTRLAGERAKLLRAHYAGAVSLELFASEQKRIDSETRHGTAQLRAAEAKLHRAKATVARARELGQDLARAYQGASPLARRGYNLALFARIDVSRRRVTGAAYREPFHVLVRSRGPLRDGLARPRPANPRVQEPRAAGHSPRP